MKNTLYPYLEKFWKYRSLLVELIKRDLKVKYRRSYLGYLWSLLNPLLMMLVVNAVFSSFFRYDIPNFPVYLLTGQILFNFYNESTTMAMSSILGGAALIKKVALPKYIFPISRVLSCFINLLFSLVAIVIVFFVTRTPFHWQIVLFPFPLFYILAFSMGVGMILSILAVYFRDIVHLYGVMLTALMYLTPIFYPMSILPEYVQAIVHLNPLFYFIQMFRNVTMYGIFPSLTDHLVCLVISGGTLLIGVLVFVKNQSKFVLHI